MRRGFLSISQSRKTRGGRDFELQVGCLLELMGVPFEKKKRRYRVDFMIPSDDAFHHNPNRSIILSAKRTLRERWREVVEELQAMRSPNIYLITADENVSLGHVEGICGQYRIHLVVWDEVKKNKFSDEPLVISYTTLANEIIPLFRQFWETK
ncbi:MAG: type II restriction endonuclease [Actinomycetota bacterium]